jgi:hypothetical protein
VLSRTNDKSGTAEEKEIAVAGRLSKASCSLLEEADWIMLSSFDRLDEAVEAVESEEDEGLDGCHDLS